MAKLTLVTRKQKRPAFRRLMELCRQAKKHYPTSTSLRRKWVLFILKHGILKPKIKISTDSAFMDKHWKFARAPR